MPNIRPVRTALSLENMRFRGIPKKFFKTSIEDFDDYDDSDLKDVKSFIKNYIESLDYMFEDNKGIFFYGSNGVGKTMLGSIIIKEAYRHRYTSKRCTFVSYIAEYTRIWGIRNAEEKEEAEALFYNDYKAVEFLFLEEVGKEIDSKIAQPILEDLLRYREDKGLPTIIATNIPPKQITEQYGSSISSLIKGNMTPIKIVGTDRRKEVFESESD
jgi:DNA replication protein DnaC